MAEEDFAFGFGLEPGMEWSAYLKILDDHRRGYAAEILRQSLIIVRAVGVDRALMFCDDDNAGSIAVIEGCGGKLNSVINTASGPPTRRYWID